MIKAKLEDQITSTESLNCALLVFRFKKHTRSKITPFELHHGSNPRIELTKIVKNGKTYLSNWSEIVISAPNRPKPQIYVGSDAEGRITNHIIMAKTKTVEKHLNEGPKSPKKKNSVSYPSYYIRKKFNKKINKKGNFKTKRKLQKAEPRVL